MRQIKTTTLPTTAPFIVVQRHPPVAQAIARRVVMTPSVVLPESCAILESRAGDIHQCAAIEHPPAVVRTLWLVNRARPVVHSLDQRSGTTPAFQPALFGNQDLLALPAGSRPTEQLSLFETGTGSPGQTDFFATLAAIEPFTKNTTGVLNVRHEPCAVRPVIPVRPRASDWPRRLSWSLLRSPLETVCRSAARNPRIAARLERMIISSLAARSQETADRMTERLRRADHGPLFLRLVNRLAGWPTASGVASRPWGEDACTDALRARWIGKRTGQEQVQQATAAGYSWVGSLRWIGEQALRQAGSGGVVRASAGVCRGRRLFRRVARGHRTDRPPRSRAPRFEQRSLSMDVRRGPSCGAGRPRRRERARRPGSARGALARRRRRPASCASGAARHASSCEPEPTGARAAAARAHRLDALQGGGWDDVAAVHRSRGRRRQVRGGMARRETRRTTGPPARRVVPVGVPGPAC